MSGMQGKKQYSSTRIKLKDKRFNTVKKMVENLVIAHGGSFADAKAESGKVKSKYERKVDGKVLRFIYTYHTTISDRKAARHCRSQFHTHLRKLEIEERLPSLMVRSSTTYDDDMLKARKSTKTGEAFVALENAFIALEEQLEEELLNYNKELKDMGK